MIRLRRVSWKSKNNVFLLNSKELENSQEIKIDLLIFCWNNKNLENLEKVILEKKWKNYVSSNWTTIFPEEIEDIIKNTLEIDNTRISKEVWACCLTAMSINQDLYFWKNIWILYEF